MRETHRASEESGNNTEKALLRVVGNHFQVDFNVLRKAHRSLWTASFSSTRKVRRVFLPAFCIVFKQPYQWLSLS